MIPVLHYGLAVLIGLLGYSYWHRWLGSHQPPLRAIVILLAVSAPLVLIGGHLAWFVSSGLPATAAGPYFLTLRGWSAGYLSLGSLAGVALALPVVARACRLPARYLADLFSPAVFIVSAIWRIGCFFHGCCYGAPTQLPWGVSFAVVPELNIFTPPSHPVQLYEAGASLIAFLILPLLAARLALRPGNGMIALLVATVYCLERFVLEFFRIGGTTRVLACGFSATQLVCGAGLALLAILWWLARRGSRPR